MAIEGEGIGAMTTIWIFTGLTFIFVLLRLYTRIVVTRSYGMDDTVYILAFFFFLLSAAFTTRSAYLGFGRNIADIANPDDVVDAILWELIGQTFSVIGMALAKWSLGLFLLRLVTKVWLKRVIWAAMGGLMSASVSVCFVSWLQCTPYKYLWDRRISGECHINAVPASTVLNSATIIVDFLFAALPWLFIWELQVNKQEKTVILTTMSLGVIAAACGIKRAAENGGLSSPNYLKDTVPLIVWSAIEQGVTMICIGIAVCLPLYKGFLRYILSAASGYSSNSGRNMSYRLGEDHKRASASREPQIRHGREQPRGVNAGDTEAAMSQGRTEARCYVDQREELHAYRQSDEQVLLDNISKHPDPSMLSRGIQVTEEFGIMRSD